MKFSAETQPGGLILRRSPCGERGLKCGRFRPFPASESPSLPVRGAWVEILRSAKFSFPKYCRSPCGERGLKCRDFTIQATVIFRRSPCGERGLKYQPFARASCTLAGRSPCGERGLKYHIVDAAELKTRRSPCGERGLKSTPRCGEPPSLLSLPVRGAWVEISLRRHRRLLMIASLPVRGAWVEIPFTAIISAATAMSLPVRGAWVEICFAARNRFADAVAPRAGSVG